MEHKGFFGEIDLDDEASVFHGEVVGIRDGVTIEGTSVDELRAAFEASIDDYLAFFEECGEAPEKPISGRFVLRVDPELHRKISMLASATGKSLNAWIVECLDYEVSQHGVS